MLPPFYDMDNYRECVEKNETFCIAELKLKATSAISRAWDEIVGLQDNPAIFDRSILRRGLCFPNGLNNTRKLAETMINRNIPNYNLTSSTANLMCINNDIKNSSFDAIVLSIGVLIILFTLKATWMEHKGISPENLFDKLLINFSIIKNWKTIIQTETKGNSPQMKSIQGIRVLFMLFIILKHTFITVLNSFFDDVSDIDKFMATNFMQFISQGSVFLVNAFFMISAFLITNQIYNLYHRNRTFSFRDVLVLIINRYFRLVVLNATVIAISQVSLLQKFIGPSSLRIWTLTNKSCQNWWMYAILMGHNYVYVRDMCYIISWYISADFHAYIIISVILYAMFRFKLNEKMVLLSSLLISIIIHGFVIHAYNTDILFRPGNLREYDPYHFSMSPSFLLLYTGTHSTLSSSFIGMICGAIYYKIKDYEIKSSFKIYDIIFVVLFGGLIYSAFVVSLYKYNKMLTLIIGTLVKPMFVSGLGIAVLGMTVGLGSWLNSICRWKLVGILSNISFATYLCNFFTMIYGGASTSTLIKFQESILLTEYGSKLLFSLVAGFILTILVELPALSIQKMLLPQVTRAKQAQKTI